MSDFREWADQAVGDMFGGSPNEDDDHELDDEQDIEAGESDANESTDVDEPDGDPQLPTTGAEFVGWVLANADYIQGEYDMTVGEYLSSMIGLSDREWVSAARAAGISQAARPSHNDLRGYGRAATGAVFAVDWQRDLERMRAAGRRLGE